MERIFIKANLIRQALFVMLVIFCIGCNKTNNTSGKVIIEGNGEGNQPKTEKVIIKHGNSEERVMIGGGGINIQGRDHKSSQVTFSRNVIAYNSPLIYLKDDSNQLHIAEKNGIQTLYGFSGDESQSSSLSKIEFNFFNFPVESWLLNIVRDSETQPTFCQNLNASIKGNFFVLSINKNHEKLTTLTTCSFKLTHTSRELPASRFIFNFSYTNKDWKEHSAAVDVNHTINVLEEMGIKEDTTELKLVKKEIKDITPILGLVNLEFLSLEENNLTKTSGLSILKKLEKLSIANEKNLTDISDVFKLRKLNMLVISNIQPKQFSGLSLLHDLKWLDLSNNHLTSVPDLSNLTQLRMLNLTNNQLTSVLGLSNLKKLEKLYLGINHFKEFPDLPKSNNLKTLYINDNYINLIPSEKLSWIRNNIKEFNLNNNPGFPNFGN